LLVACSHGAAQAIPFIPLQTRNARGTIPEQKKAKRKLLCYRFYLKNFIHRFWVDPDSKRFDREYDRRTDLLGAGLLGREGLPRPGLSDAQG
jgi:hypothetical protein